MLSELSSSKDENIWRVIFNRSLGFVDHQNGLEEIEREHSLASREENHLQEQRTIVLDFVHAISFFFIDDYFMDADWAVVLGRLIEFYAHAFVCKIDEHAV